MVSSAAMTNPHPGYRIRSEAPGDAAAIAAAVAAAFGQPPEGRPGEADLVAALRAAGALTLSLVAEAPDGTVIGYIAFSPVTIDGAGGVAGEGLLGLAPLAVVPAWQGRGVGAALVAAGLARARDRGAGLVVVLGEPAYYRRFGFRPAAGWGLAWEHPAPPEAFMALELRPGAARPSVRPGALRYHPAFDVFSE